MIPWLWDNQVNFRSTNVNGVCNKFNGTVGPRVHVAEVDDRYPAAPAPAAPEPPAPTAVSENEP